MTSTTVSTPGVPTTEIVYDWSSLPVYPNDCPVCINNGEERTLDAANETHFLPEEAPSANRSMYRRLDLHNRDKFVGRVDLKVWKTVDTEFHEGLIKGMASQLELNEKQVRFAVNLYHSVDKQKIGRWSELIGLCCCIHALDVGDSKREYHPSRNDENNDPVFVRIADWLKERYPIDQWDILSVLNKIEDRHL